MIIIYLWISKASTVAFFYGSLTSKTTTQGSDTLEALVYTYNLQNRLATVTTTPYVGNVAQTAEVVEYTYNTDGIRTSKVVDSTYQTDYLIDPANHTGYAQVLEETTVDITNPGSPILQSTVYYTIGDDVLAQSRAEDISGTWTVHDTEYLLYDGHGSTRQLARADQSIVDSYNYDAYGVMLGSTADPNPAQTAGTSLLYAGEQYDANLDEYYLRARYYNQNNGTFNSVDPHSGNMQDPQSLHKYAYVHNNPVNATDPSGNSMILDVTVQMAIRAVISAAVFGTMSFVWAKAKGATWSQALWAGLQTAAITGMAFLSPLFAWCLLALTPVLLALNIYSGDLTGKDIPEIVTYLVAGIALMLVFKSPGYKVWETKTVIKSKIPQALKNLEAGTTTTPKTARTWQKAKISGNKSVQGTCIHKELADIMRNEGMSNLGIEISYNSAGEIVSYGTKGSIRADYTVYHKGEVVKVFDLKPTDVISGSWLKKTSQYLSLSADDIEAINYR